jgi:hypothetical protein
MNDGWPDFWADAKRVDILAIAQKHGARLKKNGTAEWTGPCPLCGGDDRFSINVKKRVFNCRGCGLKGDVIDLVECLKDLSKVEAGELLAGRPRPDRSRDETAEERAARQAMHAQRLLDLQKREEEQQTAEAAKTQRDEEAIEKILGRALDLDDPLAAHGKRHLVEGRGLKPHKRLTKDIKFVPDLDYWGLRENGVREIVRLATLPAIVAIIHDQHGAVIGLSQVWLDPEQPVKWTPTGSKDNSPRKIRGQKRGGLIRLGQIGETLALSEGWENCLSWYQLGHGPPDVTLAAAIDLGNLASVILPKVVRNLILVADNDSEPRALIAKFREAIVRFQSLGLNVSLAWPTPGSDWNHVLLHEARGDPLPKDVKASEETGHLRHPGGVETAEEFLKRTEQPEPPRPEPPDRGVPPPGEELPTPQLEIFDVGDEDGNIPPREWLLGTTFCRSYLSGLISAGAGGKTTVRILQALSLASGRSLSGEYVFVRCRVMIICLEDDMKELRRRVRAAMLRHKVTPAEVKGFLILTTPRGIKIAERDAKTGNVVTGGLYRALAEEIDDRRLDLVCIDPAIKAHSLKENDNPEIDAFASILTQLASEKNIAIDLLSHERKGSFADAGDINRGRGASSQKDAQRLAYTLTGMSETEANALGVSDEERASLVRLDSAKVNIAPPSRTATWFRLVGVNLGNGTATYPNGDNVQTVELWKPPPLFDKLYTPDLNCVLRKLNVGMGNGQRYSLAPGAKDRAAWHAVHEQFPDLGEERCRAIITEWAGKELFEVGEYDDPVRRTKVKGILSAKLLGDMEWGSE